MIDFHMTLQVGSNFVVNMYNVEVMFHWNVMIVIIAHCTFML